MTSQRMREEPQAPGGAASGPRGWRSRRWQLRQVDPRGGAAGDGTCGSWTPDLPMPEVAPARSGPQTSPCRRCHLHGGEMASPPKRPRTCWSGRWHLREPDPGPPRAGGAISWRWIPDLRRRHPGPPPAGDGTCLEGGGWGCMGNEEYRMTNDEACPGSGGRGHASSDGAHTTAVMRCV